MKYQPLRHRPTRLSETTRRFLSAPLLDRYSPMCVLFDLIICKYLCTYGVKFKLRNASAVPKWQTSFGCNVYICTVEVICYAFIGTIYILFVRNLLLLNTGFDPVYGRDTRTERRNGATSKTTPNAVAKVEPEILPLGPRFVQQATAAVQSWK